MYTTIEVLITMIENERKEISILLDLAMQTYRDFLETGSPAIAELYYTQCQRISNMVKNYNQKQTYFKMVVVLPDGQQITG